MFQSLDLVIFHFRYAVLRVIERFGIQRGLDRLKLKSSIEHPQLGNCPSPFSPPLNVFITMLVIQGEVHMRSSFIATKASVTLGQEVSQNTFRHEHIKQEIKQNIKHNNCKLINK